MAKAKKKKASPMNENNEEAVAAAPAEETTASIAAETQKAQPSKPGIRQETDTKVSEIRQETDNKIAAETQKAQPSKPGIRQETDTKVAETLIDPSTKVAQDDLIAKFERYTAAMGGNRPIESERVGANHQMLLWRLIDETLRRSGNSFTSTFTTLLSLLQSENHSRGTMDPRHRYRFFGALPLGRDEAAAFEAILAALITVSDPKTRSLSLKQVDFQKAFRSYSDKTALARVSDYFDL